MYVILKAGQLLFYLILSCYSNTFVLDLYLFTYLITMFNRQIFIDIKNMNANVDKCEHYVEWKEHTATHWNQMTTN